MRGRERGRRGAGAALLCAVALLGLGSNCEPGSGGFAATVRINAVEPPLDDLIVVPPAGFVVEASFSGGSPDPASLRVLAYPWSGAAPRDLTPAFSVEPDRAYAVIPPGLGLQAPNSYTLTVEAEDGAGASVLVSRSFAVRAFPYGPPIGTGQAIWYDFEVDRDGDLQPDFPVDLQGVGLGSPAAPSLSADVEARVVDALLARVELAYHAEDPNGLGLDPVDVLFSSQDPGPGDVTRICVGGVAPGSPNLIGSVLIDPNNQSRSGSECSTIPPTGVFAGGMQAYASSYHFQKVFDPLMASRGGTPVGEDPLDPVVLDPGFDYASASAAEQARYDDIATAIQRYADALGSVVAHETGHALGLVAPGAPGAGLYGGGSGAAYAHDVQPDGTTPAPNYLMKAGNTLGFQQLAGMGSNNPLPFFRPLDFAWLRDRAVVDPSLSELLPPPTLTGVDPGVIDADGFLTLTGSHFVATPRVTLWNASFQYETLFETLDSPSQVRAFVSISQVLPGQYLVLLTNPDGQMALPPQVVVVE